MDPRPRLFRFGQFEADSSRNTLTRLGSRIKIQDQPFRVLVLLLESPGELVTRETLRQALWPDGIYVDFDGSLNVIVKKLRAAISDDPDNPRFVETVPRHGYRFIAPVAVVRGSGDSQTLSEGTPGQARVTIPPASTATASKNSAKGILILSGALVLILLGTGWIFRRQLSAKAARSKETSTVPLAPRRSAAVLGFQNLSARPGDAWMSTGLSEMLRTELAGGEKLRLVPGEDVVHLRVTSPWSQTDTLNQETTARLGKALDADYLILGSYSTAGIGEHQQIRLDVRLQEAKQGEILAEIAEVGDSQELFKLVARVGARMRERLGVPRIDEMDQAGVLASLPADGDAARFYALGIEKLRQFDALAAKNLLEQSARAEPNFPLVHTMLARAWTGLGYEQKRKEEAKKALELAANVPRAEQLLIEGDYYQSLLDHDKAASTYQALFELFPDSVDYGLLLAGAQLSANHDSQAMETIARLRRLPAPASEDPRLDLLAARAIPANIPARLELVRSAERKADAVKNRLLYAQARKEECLNLNYSQEPTQSRASCEEAFSIYMMAGNRLMAADAQRLIGDENGTLGRLEEAIASYNKALALLDGMGEHAKTGAILNNMAIAFENQGKLEKAEQLYHQAQRHFEEAGDKGNAATALGNIGDIFFLRGQLTKAKKSYQQAFDIESVLENDHPDYVLSRMADLALARGQVSDAHRDAQKAVELGRQSQGEYQYLTSYLITLGEVLSAEGDLQGARKQFQEALQLRQKAGETQLVAESQTTLARLDIEEGHASQAESALRAAITEFETEHEEPKEVEACTLLSQALLILGNLDGSRQAIHRAVEISTRGGDARNQPLSEQRAASVITWLTAHGTDAVHLVPQGFGASRPVADNATSAGRALNRRVEVSLSE